MMYARDQLPNRLIRTSSLHLNQFPDGFSVARFFGIMLFEHCGKSFVREQPGFFFGHHGKLWVQFEFVKMLPNELEAEAVQGADVRRLEKRELFLPARISRIQFRLTFQARTNALSDF